MSGQEREAGSAGRWRRDLSGERGGICPCGIGRTMDLKAGQPSDGRGRTGRWMERSTNGITEKGESTKGNTKRGINGNNSGGW